MHSGGLTVELLGDLGLVGGIARRVLRVTLQIQPVRLGKVLGHLFGQHATTIEQFIKIVDSCIHWYNEKRLNMSLGSLSPFEYLNSLGLAV